MPTPESPPIEPVGPPDSAFVNARWAQAQKRIDHEKAHLAYEGYRRPLLIPTQWWEI